MKYTGSELLSKIGIFDYIEIFYNRQRRHSALNQKTLLEYYLENKSKLYYVTLI